MLGSLGWASFFGIDGYASVPLEENLSNITYVPKLNVRSLRFV